MLWCTAYDSQANSVFCKFSWCGCHDDIVKSQRVNYCFGALRVSKRQTQYFHSQKNSIKNYHWFSKRDKNRVIAIIQKHAHKCYEDTRE